jgi:RimJ/RimL family protein N-acetyltransferase
MGLVVTREVGLVPAPVGDFLAARVQRNVMASLLIHARAGRLREQRPVFGWSSEGEAIRWFAMRTPPWPLLTSELDLADVEQLLDAWLPEDPVLPGVSGEPVTARAIAESWSLRTGGSSRCQMREAVHLLGELIEPAEPPSGRLRPARIDDRELLVRWEHEFVIEARLPSGAASEVERTIERRLDYGGQFVWDDGGPVCTVGHAPQVAGTLRIGPVYTSPENRGRGYASAAVAGICRDALARGVRQCMLFTDLTNPTSNKIYAALGFERCGDWEELTFLPGA